MNDQKKKELADKVRKKLGEFKELAAQCNELELLVVLKDESEVGPIEHLLCFTERTMEYISVKVQETEFRKY